VRAVLATLFRAALDFDEKKAMKTIAPNSSFLSRTTFLKMLLF
jgi:hypothetical protein